MDSMKRFEQFAELARNESPPKTNVAGAVLKQIRTEPAGAMPDAVFANRIIGAAAAFAAVAALVAGLIGYNAMTSLNGVGAWLNPMDWIGSL